MLRRCFFPAGLAIGHGLSVLTASVGIVDLRIAVVADRIRAPAARIGIGAYWYLLLRYTSVSDGKCVLFLCLPRPACSYVSTGYGEGMVTVIIYSV